MGRNALISREEVCVRLVSIFVDPSPSTREAKRRGRSASRWQ